MLCRSWNNIYKMSAQVSLNIWRTCNKIRSAIFRVGINLWKYFKPLDSMNDGLISEAQFVSVLAGPLKLSIGLSELEILEIANYFKVQDGRILYSDFCEVIHGEVPNFSKNDPLTTGLEWNDPYHVNQISKYEEKRLQILLTKIATSLHLNSIVLRPYFQDYELITKGNGTVTISHFARVLNFLGILLSAEDFNILLKKFMQDSYCVNYVAFLAVLSDVKEYMDLHNLPDNKTDSACNKMISKDFPKLIRPEIRQFQNRDVFGPRVSFHPATNPCSRWNSHNTIEKTMGRIQRHALANHIRTEEFFKDYDDMHCGKIKVEQFRRGLDAFGISGFHHLYLSEQEINDLCNAYRDSNDPNDICWKIFENDVDLIFATKNLEKHPNLKVINPVTKKMDLFSTGSCNWNCVDGRVKDLCEDVIEKIKVKIITRCLNLRTHFKDYDRLNNGHVTIPQFRQCLVYYGLLFSLEEVNALEERYCDDVGFNYLWFLNEVEPKPLENPLYDNFIREKILLNSKKIRESPENKEKDIAVILAKIKAKVVREGIRVLNFFIDYDKLNKKIIIKENFERALTLCDFKLTNTEMKTITEVFASPLHNGYIDYHKFCSIIESACTTPGLEKEPMFVPLKYIPPLDCECNFLNGDERVIVDNALLILTTQSIYDQNLLPCFQDFDISNCGSVSRNNFMRVMAVRKLTDHLSSKQLDVLAKCFRVKRGSEEEVDYRAFCKTLDILVSICNKRD